MTLLIAWSVFIYFVDPVKIIDLIGVQNSYIFGFLISVFGGLTTFTATSFIATLVTLALGGVNPWLLGLFAGLGLAISDSVFYYFGKKGSEVISKKTEKRLSKFFAWLKKQPEWLIQILVFLYIGFTPLPNDIVTISLSFSRFPYKKFIIPVFFGDLTFATLVSVAASFGYHVY
ncbi:MAG TPA: VTT domain-containing protein [Candidatus Bipolaricaulota bacterium]|nr:VTT domain-containing protein [Candidatus Bipolaricaulota bacterium]